MKVTKESLKRNRQTQTIEPEERTRISARIEEIGRNMQALSYKIAKQRALLQEDERIFEGLWREKDTLERKLIHVIHIPTRQKKKVLTLEDLAIHLSNMSASETIEELVEYGLLSEEEAAEMLAGYFI